MKIMCFLLGVILIAILTTVASAQEPWVITPGVGMGLAKLGASPSEVSAASEKMDCPVIGEFVHNRAISLFTSWGGCLATEDGIQVGVLFAWAFERWGPPNRIFVEGETKGVSVGWAYWMNKGVALRVFIYEDAVGITGVKVFYPEKK